LNTHYVGKRECDNSDWFYIQETRKYYDMARIC